MSNVVRFTTDASNRTVKPTARPLTPQELKQLDTGGANHDYFKRGSVWLRIGLRVVKCLVGVGLVVVIISVIRILAS